MDEQLGFDLGAPPPADEPFAPAVIREDALALIARARSVTADAPWTAESLRYHRVAFPHLISWLPDEEERGQLRFAFFGELDRIEALLAA